MHILYHKQSETDWNYVALNSSSAFIHVVKLINSWEKGDCSMWGWENSLANQHTYLALESRLTVPSISHPCHCEWVEKTCSYSTQNTIPLLLYCPISASCEYCDLIDATPRKLHNRENENKQIINYLTFVTPVNCAQTKSSRLTGICSTMGSSLAIVPARSQELVMLTNDWNNSAQKYPHVVPINWGDLRKEVKRKERDGKNFSFKAHRK